MEKKILGFILIALGLTGMLLAGFSFINGTGDSENLRRVITFIIPSSILLFAGINYTVPGAAMSTKSKKDELTPIRENG